MNSKILTEFPLLSEKDCFLLVERYKTEFTYPLHKHEEYELNFIENGAGVRRIIGDSVETTGDYDLVLVGKENLEHVWEQGNCVSEKIHEITIQFSPKLFLGNFLDKNQFAPIKTMLEDAQKGICFPMSAIMSVYQKINALTSLNPEFYRVIEFITILYELSQSNYRTLSSSAFASANISTDNRRIQKVEEYINKNYKQPITLPEVAKIAGMTPVSFSRFFKQSTGRGLFDFIIDTRLGYASRLLVDTTNSISEIGYDCGFNNISNFNRLFKKRKDRSPKEFRDNYRKKKTVI
ncbi:MAG: AraC family transcriptional regulator [Prevotellaceae bacterium]|jgi:AraC-like DNA-binding protein|nr:AraC family transcriptional regulator [Prevotellaceae bacterium]